jgi:uncharacterized Zn finger protein
MTKQPNTTRVDRIAQYVNSPLITQRVRYGDQLTARIEGNYGIYRTTASLQKGHEDCTCPAEMRPCKHILALRETWEVNPSSFFNLDDLVAQLPKKSKQELIELIGKMIMHSPDLLTLLGVPGFDSYEDDEEWA